MRRSLALFLPLLLLWFLVTEVNHAVTGLRIYIFFGSLFITFAALMRPLRAGIAAAIFGGLICDANSPVPFGTHVLLFTAADVIIFNIRDRVPRDDTVARIFVALLANLALFLVFSFAQIGQSPAPAAAWTRLIADLVCSQIFLALIAPWFFALQTRALALGRSGRESLA